MQESEQKEKTRSDYCKLPCELYKKLYFPSNVIICRKIKISGFFLFIINQTEKEYTCMRNKLISELYGTKQPEQRRICGNLTKQGQSQSRQMHIVCRTFLRVKILLTTLQYPRLLSTLYVTYSRQMELILRNNNDKYIYNYKEDQWHFFSLLIFRLHNTKILIANYFLNAFIYNEMFYNYFWNTNCYSFPFNSAKLLI